MVEGILFKTVLEQAIAAGPLTYPAGEELLRRIKLEKLQRKGSPERLLLKNMDPSDEILPDTGPNKRKAPLTGRTETRFSVLRTAPEKKKNGMIVMKRRMV